MKQESLFGEEVSHGKNTASPPKTGTGREAKPASRAKAPPKRRVKMKSKPDDYYDILGISEDASPAMIKQKYIEKVRQYPPESHPEEFQKIRLAYDNLRSPELRKKYDILRRYGESVEDLLQEAARYKETRYGINQAKKLLQRAVEIDPEHTGARLALAYAYIRSGSMAGFVAQFDTLRKLVGVENWPVMWGNKIVMMLETGRYDEAFTELGRFRQDNPKEIIRFWEMYTDVYAAVGREDQLLTDIERQIQGIEVPAPADIDMYIVWIKVADALDEPGKYAKAQAAAKKFIRNWRQPEAAGIIVGQLTEEYQKYREDMDYSMAKLFLELALTADKNNKTLLEHFQKIYIIESLAGELDKAFEDKRLFPLVLLEAARCFTAEFHMKDEILDALEEGLSDEILADLEGMNEEYAAGIAYLKRKYGLLYRHYQPRWEQLFKEKTAGLNREERRGLRI